MFRLASVLLGLIALALAFVAIAWSWVPFAIGFAGLLVVYSAARKRQFGPVPELSAAANEMVAKFGHYYAFPDGSADVSGAASGLQLAGFAVGIVAIFDSNWFVFSLCVFVWLAGVFFGRQFNPTRFLVDEQERLAHQEVLAFVRARRMKLAEQEMEL